MKKLITCQVFFTILTIVVFLLVFSGQEKNGREKYDAIISAVLITTFFVVVFTALATLNAVAAALAAGAVAIAATLAVVAIVEAVAVAAGIGVIGVSIIFATIGVAFFAALGVALDIGEEIEETSRKTAMLYSGVEETDVNGKIEEVSRKTAILSLGVEAVTITSIMLILAF